MADLVRPPWIALASGELFTSLAADVASGRIRVVSDPGVFGSLLATSRPLVAILAAPPATSADEAVALRERRRRRGLRLVHVTRPDDVTRRLEALRSGFDEVLTSAIDPDELVVRLQLLEARARARIPPEIAIGHGVVMDLLAHEVRKGGDLVHLRPKEFQLLALLATHPGRAYSRRQLLDRAWGPSHDGDSRTVDVHVRWLRAKLEPNPAAPVHLVTVRGVGYRLDPDGR